MDIKKAFGIKAEKFFIPDRKVEAMQNLFPGQGKGEIRNNIKADLIKRLLFTGTVAVITLLALSIKDRTIRQNTLEFIRNPMNEGSGQVALELTVGDCSVRHDFTIGSVEFTDENIDILHAQTEEALDKSILGRNPDFLHISEDLHFPQSIVVEGSNIKLSWSSDRQDLVNMKGEVAEPAPGQEDTVTIRAKVKYGAEFRVYERLLTVVPKEYTEAEKQVKEAIEEILVMESDREQSTLLIPDEINGVMVKNADKPVNYTVAGIFLAVLIPVIGYYSYFEELSEKRKKRILRGTLDYKDFVRKLTLLLSAGMSVRLSWKKLCQDYRDKDQDSLLSEALQVSLREMDSGIREQLCYQRFGERMGSKPYERLAEILSQQSVKGVAHVSQVLESELREVCEVEKEQIKVKAEKAGTALLLPIMGLLAIVFLVIMIPAFAGISL